jgi:hypothetical protein
MRFITAPLIVVAIVSWSGSVFAACVFNAMPVQFGTDNATSGECDAEGVLRSFNAGGTTSVDSTVVVAQPKHGTVEMQGRSGFRYLPAKGFHGADKFTLRMCGRTSTAQGCSNLSWNVVVK